MTRAHEPFFRCFESRFQRLFIPQSRTWGDAPGWFGSRPWRLNLRGDGAGWNKCVPSVLYKNANGDSYSAKGATLINSLGQRPRFSGNQKSSALKARFNPEMLP
jgi:hypothetical protein